MISSQQFDEALKIISEYKSQLDNGLITIKPKPVFVNIQNKISNHTFFTLQHYFNDYLGKLLERNDLSAIDLAMLKNIDFNNLRRYRGFGKMAEERLKYTIDICSINSD